jgi:hypothetical protein
MCQRVRPRSAGCWVVMVMTRDTIERREVSAETGNSGVFEWVVAAWISDKGQDCLVQGRTKPFYKEAIFSTKPFISTISVESFTK